MKKIFLFILFNFQIILINTECPTSCSSCEDPDLANEDNMLCISCADGFYPLEDKPTNCYQENVIIEGYYPSREDSKFLKCDEACKRCNGPKQSEDTNCLLCNTDGKYFPIEGNPSYCKNKTKDSSFLEIYYFDEDHQIFKRCFITCLSCSKGGDASNHNCNSCQPNYYSYESNCYLNCPSHLFTLDKECVTNCDREGYYSSLFSMSCLTECPTGTDKNTELGICAIQTTELYTNLNCDNIINNYILDNMKYFISENSFIPGRNCYIQIYNALYQSKIHRIAESKYLSKLFLNNEYYNSSIIVIKVDYNKTYIPKPEVNDIEFILYLKISDDEYQEITDIDLLTRKESNDLIYIEKPFIFLEKIQIYKDKYQIFDIFNARSEVYNDFCEDFTSEYNTDLTYDYRRENYFVNISQFCLNDSTKYYSGFNSKTTSIQCKANYIDNKFYGEEKVGNSRFKIFKCRKYLSKDLGLNLGFWMIFLIILFNIAIGYFFWRQPFIKIINFMQIFEREFNKPTGLKLRWTVLNPPRKKMKIIYQPKEFIFDKEFNENENEIQFGRYLNQYHKTKKDKINQLKKNQDQKQNKNLNLNLEKNYEPTSSSMNYTLSPRSPRNISYTKSKQSSSSLQKRKIEEEKRALEKKKKEYLNFMEDAKRKDKDLFTKQVYNQSLEMPKTDMDDVMKDYNKQQNKINEERIIKTNLLHLDTVGNVVRDPEVNFKQFNMKYEPKEYLDKYMFHNYTHLLPVPKSERVSSGSLSSDIRNELLKLQQLREKKMIETIFLKKIVFNQKLIKGYNEDFYPFSFDESIIRRKEGITYLIVFWNYLREINLIANVIFDENFLENRYIKIILLGFEFYCLIFFNLIFYSDDYINDFYKHKGKYNFFYQLTKSLYSTLCTAIVIKLTSLLITCKNRFRNLIITRKYESDNEYRKDYKFWIIILTIKIGIFYAILVTLIIFGWVYYMCFSVPYKHSQKFVLVGTIFSMLLYEIFSIGIIALVSRLKYVSIIEQHRKLYNIMMIVNYFL